MAGEAINLLQQYRQHSAGDAVRGDTDFFHLSGEIIQLVPPATLGLQLLDGGRSQAQSLANIPQCTLETVGDLGGRKPGALAAVFAVDVLDDFLASFVLEVHIDIRRLIAFAGNKALEQQANLVRVNLGNKQAVTHHGVGGRTATLVQDVLAACMLDNVVNGEEVVLIPKLGDERQFGFYLCTDMRLGTLGPAYRNAGFHQVAQVFTGTFVFRHDFRWIVVLQLLEAESTACGDCHCVVDRPLWIKCGDFRQVAQIAFRVLFQAVAELAEGAVVVIRIQYILQGLAAATVHQYGVGCDHRKLLGLGKGEQLLQFLVFSRQQVMAQGDIKSLAKVLLQLAGQCQ